MEWNQLIISISFKKHNNDMKSSWRIIKYILNSTKKKNNYPEAFWISGELISDKVVLANQLNFISQILAQILHLKY